ncbi:GTP-binding protein Rit1-like [Mytilus californianus]|uniref:GTP-binding protein Rit1-like n=1 Tax=Mytilus californianus TaxID=6549 RepID=UPI002246BD12|nr:GTP-binding protein Rit1-like [Mytilus californianus]
MNSSNHHCDNSKPREYKIVILGDGGVGKSALVIQFVYHRFLDYHDPTIEDSYQKQARIDGEPALLDILDTAGQPEFNTMREQYMRKGEGFILCYSITDRRSYDEMLTYKKLINQVRCRDDIPVILVGNKCDLHEKRKVTPDEGIALSHQFKCPFYETSAVTRQCVDDIFLSLIREIRNVEREYSDDKPKKHRRGKGLRTFIKKLNPFRQTRQS